MGPIHLCIIKWLEEVMLNAWNDQAIGIDWPLQELPVPHQPLLSPRTQG